VSLTTLAVTTLVVTEAGGWTGRVPLARDGQHSGLMHADDGIGDDLQDWCDARSRAVSGRP
jgi:hypothetical protein